MLIKFNYIKYAKYSVALPSEQVKLEAPDSPNPGKLRLGSTPRQSEPLLTTRFFRHVRSYVHIENVISTITVNTLSRRCGLFIISSIFHSEKVKNNIYGFPAIDDIQG